MNDPSGSDLDATLEKLARDKNAEILQSKRLFEQKFPGSIAPTALVEAASQYQIKSYRFDYWAAFYIRLECYVTYQTGEVRQFHGEGGGVGVGGGVYGGGNATTYFYVSPSELLGDASFALQPIAIGAWVHFWRGQTNIGTLVGAGGGTGIAFGGAGSWSPA